MVGRIGQLFHIGSNTPVNAPVELDFVALTGPVSDMLGPRLADHRITFIDAEQDPQALPYLMGMATNAGGRRRNEDSAALLGAYYDAKGGPLPVTLAAVADGMGGHAAGDTASALALQTFIEHLIDHLLSPPSGPTPALFDLALVNAHMVEAVNAAHQAVRAGTPDGGSTLTCALMIGDTLSLAHVGDSRAYVLDDAGLEVLTQDHLYVRYMMEQGAMTAQQALQHKHRHALYRAIGIDQGFDVDTLQRSIGHDGALMLCSDGVWGSLDSGDLFAHLHEKDRFPAQEVCENIVDDALRYGSSDNVTVTLVRHSGRHI